MASTGIRRKVDDLGRVVIPAGVRRTLGIREGDVLEVAVEGDRVVLGRPRDHCSICGADDRALYAVHEGRICHDCIGDVGRIADALAEDDGPVRNPDGSFAAPWERPPIEVDLRDPEPTPQP